MKISEKYIMDLLCKHDPINICDEENTDEYEAEAKMIAEKLQNVKSENDVILIVLKVFQDMFDNNLAGEKERYKDIAKNIWDLMSK